MSNTTADYLQALLSQKSLLASGLAAKGVECSEGEKFNTLIEKIGTIYDTGGLAYGEWTPTANTEIFTISGLNAMPTAFGISCEEVVKGNLVELGNVFIGIMSIDTAADTITLYKYLDDHTFIRDEIVSNLIYSITQENNTYTFSVSFAEFNEMSAKPYLFKGNYEYNWVVSSEGWFM